MCRQRSTQKPLIKIQQRINNGAFQSLVGLPGSAFCYSFKEWTTCHYALALDNGDSPGLVTSLIKAFGLLIRLTERERESEKGEGVSACYGLFRKTVPAYTSGSSASIHQWKQCQHTPLETVPAYTSGNSASIHNWKQCQHTTVETVPIYPRCRHQC